MKYKDKILKRLNVFSWILCILMMIQAFTYKIMDATITGFLFFNYSLILFPWQNKIFKKYNVKIKLRYKIIFAIIALYIGGFFVNIENKTIITCIISFFMIQAPYLIFIFFKILKNRKKK